MPSDRADRAADGLDWIVDVIIERKETRESGLNLLLVHRSAQIDARSGNSDPTAARHVVD